MASKNITMQDGLSQIASLVGAMMLAPDADQHFLNDLQQVVVAKAKEGTMPSQSPQGPAGPSPAGGGAPSPVAGPGPGAQPQQAQPQPQPQPQAGPNQGAMQPPGQGSQMTGQPAPGQGVMARPDMPNPDELRRLLLTRTGK